MSFTVEAPAFRLYWVASCAGARRVQGASTESSLSRWRASGSESSKTTTHWSIEELGITAAAHSLILDENLEWLRKHDDRGTHPETLSQKSGLVLTQMMSLLSQVLAALNRGDTQAGSGSRPGPFVGGDGIRQQEYIGFHRRGDDRESCSTGFQSLYSHPLRRSLSRRA